MYCVYVVGAPFHKAGCSILLTCSFFIHAFYQIQGSFIKISKYTIIEFISMAMTSF